MGVYGSSPAIRSPPREGPHGRQISTATRSGGSRAVCHARRCSRFLVGGTTVPGDADRGAPFRRPRLRDDRAIAASPGGARRGRVHDARSPDELRDARAQQRSDQPVCATDSRHRRRDPQRRATGVARGRTLSTLRERRGARGAQRRRIRHPAHRPRHRIEPRCRQRRHHEARRQALRPQGHDRTRAAVPRARRGAPQAAPRARGRRGDRRVFRRAGSARERTLQLAHAG